jgi:hypothetical protein
MGLYYYLAMRFTYLTKKIKIEYHICHRHPYSESGGLTDSGVNVLYE